MPVWDFYCDFCKTTIELTFRHRDESEDVKCAVCQGLLRRLPSAPSFTVKGFSAHNGYSK